MTTDELRKICGDLRIDPDPLGCIREQQLCDLLKMPRRTFYGMRDRGDAPPCMQLGGRRRYKLAAVAKWITARDGENEQ